jgi:hypothetical protein
MGEEGILSNEKVPLLAFNNPKSKRNRVVFPHPLGPPTAKITPEEK